MQCPCCNRADVHKLAIKFGHEHRYALAEQSTLVLTRPVNEYSEQERDSLARVLNGYKQAKR